MGNVSVTNDHGFFTATIEQFRATVRHFRDKHDNEIALVFEEVAPEIDFSDVKTREERLIIMAEWHGAMYLARQEQDWRDIQALLNL